MVQKNFLSVGENETEKEDSEEGSGEDPNSIGPFRCDEVVNRDLCEVRLCTDKYVRQKSEKKRDRDRRPIRL